MAPLSGVQTRSRHGTIPRSAAARGPQTPATRGSWGEPFRAEHPVHQRVKTELTSAEWWHAHVGRASTTEMVYVDFWESLTQREQRDLSSGALNRTRRRELGAALFHTTFEAAYTYRSEHLTRVAQRLVLAEVPANLPALQRVGDSTRVASAWATHLPSRLLAALATTDNIAAEWAHLPGRFTTLAFVEQALALAARAAPDPAPQEKPRQDLVDRLLASPTWISEGLVDRGSFLGTLHRHERSVLRELGGAAFETALAELIPAYRKYNDNIRRAAARIAHSMPASALFCITAPDGGLSVLAEPWLAHLPIHALHDVAHATVEDFLARITYWKTRYPDSVAGTTATDPHLLEQARQSALRATRTGETAAPQVQEARATPYAIDLCAVEKALDRMDDATARTELRKFFTDVLPTLHGDCARMQIYGISKLNGAHPMFRIGKGIGPQGYYRAVYLVDQTRRAIHVAFIGTHEDYNGYVTPANDRTRTKWAAARLR